MRLDLTEAAARRLAAYAPAGEDRFRLLYDAEGCGCAVSGVAALELTDEPREPDEREAEIGPAAARSGIRITYLERQAVFFDERMRLDYAAERLAFRLASDGQIYGSPGVADRRRRK